MSREFTKVSPRLWRSKRFRSLGTDDARLVLLFLITCEHQTSAGCFRMPDAYAASDLGWTAERMTAARDLLVPELLAFDPETDEYFVRGWFAHNKPMNASHQKAIVRRISELDSDLVRDIAEAELEPAMLPSTVMPLERTAGGSHLLNTSYMRRSG